MKIAYIMSRFPLISETFILREMMEVERQGHQIALYPLMCEVPSVVHEEAQKWIPRANCIPFLSFNILKENLYFFLRRPGLYLYILSQILFGNLSSLNFLFKGLYLLPKAVYTAKRIQEDRVDHIHAHYASHPGLEAWIIHRITGISYSLTVHSHDIYDRRSMLRPKLKNAAFIATISNYNVEFMAKLVGDWVRSKCHVVRCGIDPMQFVPAGGKKLRKNNDLFDIIQVGSLHWKKGQVYLIQTMAMLRDQGYRVRLRIIGEGDERPKLETEIQKHNLEGCVELLGAKTQSQVAEMLPSADCYIQSSVSEGIPVALMEAMACELPVVATRITGIPELVLDGRTGLLVPPGDINALGAALIKMRNAPEFAEIMGKLARSWVIDEFDLQKNASKLVGLFCSLQEGV